MDHRQNYLSLKDYIKQHFLNIVNDLPFVIDRYQDKKIEIARGLSNYNSEDLKKILGKKSEEIEVILGYMDKPEVIHRNNLVYSGEQES